MHIHTGTMYCDAVLTAHVSIFLTKKNIISIQTEHPQNGFHIYHIIARCIAHGRITFKDKEFCRKFKQEFSTEK